jgi:hypothetical protein
MLRRLALLVAPVFVALLALWPAPSRAQLDTSAVPPALLPWVPWVLDGQEHLVCPLGDGGERVCAWPGQLSLDARADGAVFVVEIDVVAETDVPLPGGVGLWPGLVRVDGVAAPVRGGGDRPTLRLGPGRHRVDGSIAWTRMPESLPLPPLFGLLAVRVDGADVAFPRREAGGALWLRAAEAREASGQDRLTVEVQRLVRDAVPMELTTRVRLQVSGLARELTVPSVLPAGFVAHGVASGLPVRLTPAGELRVQIRPGEWVLTIDAHATGRTDAVTPLTNEAPWPAEETWAFAADTTQRSVRVSGVRGIDPERTSLPGEWRAWPAYVVARGETLALEELRRGDAEPPPDSLAVQRELWLGTDGRGLTVRDTVVGQLSVGARLEALAPGELGRVDVNGTGRVITALDGGPAGIEVREGHLNATADLAYAQTGDLPAVGWSRDASSLRVELNLPPGWELLTASGADRVSGSWVKRWSLLDLFVLLVTVLALRAVVGTPTALLALVVLGLSWHERESIRLLWLGVVVVHVVLDRVAVLGRVGVLRLGRAGLVVAAVVQAVLFCGVQTREGLFPQLARGGSDPMAPSWDYRDDYGVADRTTAVMAPAAPPMEALEQEMARSADDGDWDGAEEGRRERLVTRGAGGALSSSLLGEYDYAGSSRSQQFDPSEVVQTGPGVPAWQWRTASLTWNGPVAAENRIDLLLVPPWASRLVALLRALGMVALALLVARRVFADAKRRRADWAPGVPAALLLAVLLPAAAVLPSPASAQETPHPSILDTLRERLTRAPDCAPDCVDIVELGLAANADGLSIMASVHASADTVVALPGPVAAWTPAYVQLDGVPTPARVADDGFLLVRVPAGVHRLDAAGPARDTLSLSFREVPRALRVAAEGWTVAGYRADAAPPRTLELSRSTPLPSDAGGEAAEAVVLPAWVQVRRVLDIGVPWAVHGEVARLGPTGASAVLRVPLLPGESVTTPGIAVEDGFAVITLEAGQASARWDSTLEERDSIELVAPEGTGWTELWTLACSPVWHCEAEGLAPIRHMGQTPLGFAWSPVWSPWPGERVTIHTRRPAPVEGAATTIDRAALSVSGGRDLRDVTLELRYRSSQGGEHTVTLPAEARLQSFTIDSAAVPVTSREGVVTFRIEPGEHSVVVAWREDSPRGLRLRTPAIALDGAAVNATVSYTLPSNRWILWAGGPAWGPVVTIWQYVIALAIAALLLARFAPVPLGALGWFVLGLGTSQADPVALFCVVGFLVLVGIRGQRGDRPGGIHNLLQLVVVAAALPAAGSLLFAIQQGLRLHPPDMGVSGAGSYGQALQWYADRIEGAIPQGWVLVLPLWIWHVLMLAWALWLASQLVRWAKWGWAQFNVGGLWRSLPPRAAKEPPPSYAPFGDAPGDVASDVPGDAPGETATDSAPPAPPPPAAESTPPVGGATVDVPSPSVEPGDDDTK